MILEKLFSLILFIQEDDILNGGIDDTPEARQINLLRQVKAEKEQNSSFSYKHIGYKVCTIFIQLYIYICIKFLFTDIFFTVYNM